MSSTLWQNWAWLFCSLGWTDPELALISTPIDWCLCGLCLHLSSRNLFHRNQLHIRSLVWYPTLNKMIPEASLPLLLAWVIITCRRCPLRKWCSLCSRGSTYYISANLTCPILSHLSLTSAWLCPLHFYTTEILMPFKNT